MLADHGAGASDIFVSRLVSLRVVYLFQVVDIAYRDGEALRHLFSDLLVQAFLRLHVGMLALHPRQRIGVCRLSYRAQQNVILLFPPLGGKKVVQHHAHREQEQAAQHQRCAQIQIVNLVGLFLNERRVLLQAGASGLSVVIIPDLSEDPLGRRRVLLRHPGQCRKHDQQQQDQPYNDTPPVIPIPVPVHDAAEKQQPQDGPGCKQNVAFVGHGVQVHQARQQQQRRESDHQRRAGRPRRPVKTVSVLSRFLEHGPAHQAIDHGGPQRGHVHHPSDGGPAHQRNQAGKDHHGPDTVLRLPVAVHLRQLFGQQLVSSQGVQQPAQRHQIADQTRQDHRKQRDEQDRPPRVPQIVPRRVEGRQPLQSVQVSQIPDISQPAVIGRRIGGHGQHRQRHIYQRRHRYGQNQHPMHLSGRESKLRREMRHVFEADKGPGRNRGNPQDLPRFALFRNHQRRKGEPASAAPADQRNRQAPEQAHCKRQRQRDHQRLRRFSGLGAQ